jgi:hypothetical protein
VIDNNLKVCVTGRRWGYEAWIIGHSGQKLAPISIGKPSTVKTALRIAAQKAQRMRTGVDARHELRRGPRPTRR